VDEIGKDLGTAGNIKIADERFFNTSAEIFQWPHGISLRSWLVGFK
jgi:hypothetical protein